MASRRMMSRSTVAFIAISCISALVGGFVLGMLVPPLAVDDAFRRDFFTSSGFAGSAALAAAIVAYAAARNTTKSAREQALADRELSERRDRKVQWWARAEWALTQVVGGDAHAAGVGLGVLEALEQSEWADEHESDVIASALTYALNVVDLPGNGVGGEKLDTEPTAPDPSTAPPANGTMKQGGSNG